MDDLLRDFLAETSESLAILDVELVKFEQCPNDADILMNIFRVMHTIKGTCGFLGLARLEKVAHAGEDVLGKFRDGALAVTSEAVSVILQCIDRIRDILTALEQRGSESDGDDRPLIDQLHAIADGRTIGTPVGSAPSSSATSPQATAGEAGPLTGGPVISDEGFPVAAELLEECAQALAASADAVIATTAAAERLVAVTEAPAPLAPTVPDPVPVSAPARTVAAPAAVPAPAGSEGNSRDGKSSAAQQSIRVHVEVLENLMTLVSELVLTRNNLLQKARAKQDSDFIEPLQRLSLITTDLQEGVMKTRMQPVGNAWAKLPRIVRDLAVETGKHLDLQMSGAETEVDRQVLELIKDPLTHMVRNSADHGIELPQERVAAGKPECGTVVLRAFHQGGHIIIEIADDGRGLDLKKIRKKILDSGLATEAELDGMSDTQVQQFIFKAGFSTADKVTNVSGRGVGMDVVRTNIERIGGNIELHSASGRGSTFTIKIPLTLAIVSALIVACGSERFAIPQLNVRELVHVAPGAGLRVAMVNNTPLLRLRDRLLPLVRLNELLHMDDPAPREQDTFFVVVTQVGTQSFGIIVDQVFDTEEIVVKPVTRMLRRIPFYSGNTILGDGSVIMILDPNGIATTVGQAAVSATTERETAARHDSGMELILFRAGPGAPKAVPMRLVARLENFELAAFEVVGGRQFVQYRGELMPLISVDGSGAGDDEGRSAVLVFANGDRSVGLLVDEVIDIVRDRLTIAYPSECPGSLGTAVISGHATQVIDAAFYLTQAYGDWFEARGRPDGEGGEDHLQVLLVDNSTVSVNLLAPGLAAAGVGLLTAVNADQALHILETGAVVDVVVVDIENQAVSGLDLAATLAAHDAWRGLPAIALVTQPTSTANERARRAGFVAVAGKTEPEVLARLVAQFATGGRRTLKEAA